MKLKFIREYASIFNINETDLPDFVLLTGLNGSGKSQLLEAIELGHISIDDFQANVQPPQIKRYDWTSLVPNEFEPDDLEQTVNERKGNEKRGLEAIKKNIDDLLLIAQECNLTGYNKQNIEQLVNITEEEITQNITNPNAAKEIFQKIRFSILNAQKRILCHPSHQYKVLNERLQSDPQIAFNEKLYLQVFPLNSASIDPFNQSLAALFSIYEKLKVENEFNEFLATQKGVRKKFLTNEQFISIYGEPPWIFINDLLKNAEIPCHIPAPNFYENKTYQPKLIHNDTKKALSFSRLSSGERILLSFAFSIYYTWDKRQIVQFPSLLLLDEVDAPLHPSMTRKLLDIIIVKLVKEKGIKVIMTTHSPSTVALAPDNAIFTITKGPHKTLKNTAKDLALSLLTTGVPSLSMLHQNRRQVFVESNYDAKIYEFLFEKLKTYLNGEISLGFISSGVGGNGSCDQVREVVNKLVKNGNPTVFGIIDWDLKNGGNDRVKVLGKNSRYSIENYIFDPILLAAFLIREKYMDKSIFGLQSHELFSHFPNYSSERLQNIANLIFSEISSLGFFNTENSEMAECEYVNGRTISMPTYFLHTQGHELESSIKETFPMLKRFQGEGDLKYEVLRKVIDDIPELIPKDILLLFKELQGKTE